MANGERNSHVLSSDSSSSDEDGPPHSEHDLNLLHAASSSVALVYAEYQGVAMNGTGFRIGSNYLLTAKHVIQHCLNTAGELCGQADVRAGFDDQNLSVEDLEFRFANRVRLASSPGGGGLDFDIAILEFDKRHSTGLLPPPIDVLPSLDPSESVHIIGYPRRWGPELHKKIKILDPGCRLVHPCDFMPWDEYPDQDYDDAKHGDHYVFYDCWILHGASGAPVLQCADGRCGAVAVHVTGFPKLHYEQRANLCQSEIEANDFDKARRSKYRLFEAGDSLSAFFNAMPRDFATNLGVRLI